MRRSMSWGCRVVLLVGALFESNWGGLAWGATVYKCPGPPVLYTDAITAKEAQEKGCTALDSAPVTVIAAPPRRVGPGGAAATPTASAASSPAGAPRVDPMEQRSRDSDRKQILLAELKKEEQLLAAMQAEYNNGEPERQGGEKNYQRYIDRVAEMKAGIARKESDVAALKRELAKLP